MNIRELKEQATITRGGMRVVDVEKFAKLVAAHEREAIADEYWSALLSDMEHGVKCLNIQAAKDFNRTMPELSKFGRWLNDRSDAHEEHRQVN